MCRKQLCFDTLNLRLYNLGKKEEKKSNYNDYMIIIGIAVNKLEEVFFCCFSTVFKKREKRCDY